MTYWKRSARESILEVGAAYWNEQIRNLSFILFPSIAILGRALLNISVGSMQNHRGEECSVEPRERTIKASDETPR